MVAPTILWRYILRDVLAHTLLGLTVFTVLLVAQNVLRALEQLLAAGVSATLLVQLTAIVLPSYLAYAIPVSLLFGVLLTFGRMSADGEVVAIRAAGVSVPRLLPPVLAIGLVCAGFTAYLQFEVEPTGHYRLKRFVRELATTVNVLEPGEFHKFGGRTIYVSSAGDETCPYRGVLIGDLSEAPKPVFISARCGRIDSEGEAGLALQLTEGSIHFSDSDPGHYRKIGFQTMRIAFDVGDQVRSSKRGHDFTLSELLELKRRFARGEQPEIRRGNGERTVDVQIHRRLAFSMASLLLGMLAVPLGIRPLRSGRSAGAITAVGVMAVYWLAFTTGEVMAEGGHVPPWLGIWTANVLVAALTVYLLRRTVRGDS
jgi:lipopolysaccharide export system permease protein